MDISQLEKIDLTTLMYQNGYFTIKECSFLSSSIGLMGNSIILALREVIDPEGIRTLFDYDNNRFCFYQD